MKMNDYKSAMDNIQFSPDLDKKILDNIAIPRQTKTIKRWRLASCAAVIILLVLCIPLLRNENKIALPNSTGNVTAQYIDHIPFRTSLSFYSLNTSLTEDEIFSMDTVIFEGMVTGIKNMKIDFNGSKNYRTIAQIRVNETFRGELDVGETITVLLPCIIGDGLWTEDSDVISTLQVGHTGIFMPTEYDETTYWEENNAKVLMKDLADYGFSDGIRFAFIDTKDGLVFDNSTFTSLESANSLDNVERYIIEMLQNMN